MQEHVQPVVGVDVVRGDKFYTQLRSRVTVWLEDRKISGNNREYLMLLPDLLALLIRLLRDSRVDLGLKLQLGLALTYVILPLDLIPDVLGPIGFIDDAVALTLVLLRVVGIMGQAGEEILREHWEGGGDILMQLHKIATTHRVSSCFECQMHAPGDSSGMDALALNSTSGGI